MAMIAHGSREAPPQRVLIVGGGVAGVAVAAALRCDGFEGCLRLVSEERALPYRRALLATDYLRGVVRREDLLIHPVEWYRESRVDLVLGARALGIDRLAGTVEVRGHGPVRYDRLVLATGRVEHVPPGLPPAHGVGSMGAVDALRQAAATARRAAVMGDGTVAHQVVTALRWLGLQVSLVHLDAMAHDVDAAAGVDLLVRALDTRPDMRLAADARLGSTEGVQVGPAGRTIDPLIFATGGLVGIKDGAAAEAHARSVARAILGLDVAGGIGSGRGTSEPANAR